MVEKVGVAVKRQAGVENLVGGVGHRNDGKAVLSISVQHRSEERRVGKEGRSRWSPYHLKKTIHRTQRWLSMVAHRASRTPTLHHTPPPPSAPPSRPRAGKQGNPHGNIQSSIHFQAEDGIRDA